jgi:hypothetical protein
MSIAAILHVISGLILNVVSFLVPCRYSYKALEAQYLWEKWLAYWVVFGTFCVLEHWTFFLVSRIPFWSLIKLAFVIWLQLPQTQVLHVLMPQVSEVI